MKLSLRRFNESLRNARFFSLSAAIHLILGVTLGGVVMFKVAPDAPDFVVSETASFLMPEDETALEAGDAPLSDPIEFEQETASAPSTAGEKSALQASVLTSLTTTETSFRLPSITHFQTVGRILPQTSGNSEITTVSTTPGQNSAPAPAASRKMAAGFFGIPVEEQVPGLSGTFYDLKQTPNRRPTDMNGETYVEVVKDFVKGWRDSKLTHFYRANQRMVVSQIFMPQIDATLGPRAFGVEKEVQPSLWLVHYKGRVSPPKTGTFHFVGGGDDIMIVRFDGKIVLDRCATLVVDENHTVTDYQYGFGENQRGFAKGRPITVEKGKFYDIEILIGEQPGAWFYASLLIEEQGHRYDKDAKGNPILPVFRVDGPRPPKENESDKYPPHDGKSQEWQLEQPKVFGTSLAGGRSLSH